MLQIWKSGLLLWIYNRPSSVQELLSELTKANIPQRCQNQHLIAQFKLGNFKVIRQICDFYAFSMSDPTHHSLNENFVSCSFLFLVVFWRIFVVVASILSGSFVEVCIALVVLCVFSERPDKTFEKAFLCGFVEHWWELGRLDEQLVCRS